MSKKGTLLKKLSPSQVVVLNMTEGRDQLWSKTKAVNFLIFLTKKPQILSSRLIDGRPFKNCVEIIVLSVKDHLYISWLQAKALLHLNLFNKASTFNQLGSLSSTDETKYKNKQRKLQKVKVKYYKLEFNNQNFWF